MWCIAGCGCDNRESVQCTSTHLFAESSIVSWWVALIPFAFMGSETRDKSGYEPRNG